MAPPAGGVSPAPAAPPRPPPPPPAPAPAARAPATGPAQGPQQAPSRSVDRLDAGRAQQPAQRNQGDTFAPGTNPATNPAAAQGPQATPWAFRGGADSEIGKTI